MVGNDLLLVFRLRVDSAQALRGLSDLGLEGVPGFFFRSGAWRLRWMRPGYFVGYRDALGRVLGLSYRLDEPLDGGKSKYMWLSSNPEDATEAGRQKYPRGAKLTPPVHVAGRHLLADAREILLTEGALKADVCFHLSGVPLLASAGVNQWGTGFAEEFARSFPGARAVVAFDSDFAVNAQVKWALESLMASLRNARVPYVVRSWPASEGKGLDDVLLNYSRRGAHAA